MTRCDDAALSFETLLYDPLTRLVMESDGVTARDLIEALEIARASIAARERQFLIARRTELARYCN